MGGLTKEDVIQKLAECWRDRENCRYERHEYTRAKMWSTFVAWSIKAMKGLAYMLWLTGGWISIAPVALLFLWSCFNLTFPPLALILLAMASGILLCVVIYWTVFLLSRYAPKEVEMRYELGSSALEGLKEVLSDPDPTWTPEVRHTATLYGHFLPPDLRADILNELNNPTLPPFKAALWDNIEKCLYDFHSVRGLVENDGMNFWYHDEPVAPTAALGSEQVPPPKGPPKLYIVK